MPTFLVPLPSSAPRNQVTPRLSLVLYRRRSQPVLSNPLHPPEPPDPPDPTITPQPPPSSSVNTSPPQSPSLFCARPSSISVQSPRSLPSPFRFHLSLHNKVSKLVLVWRSLADSWEVADASMLESPTPQGHVNQNRQPLPFVGLHQLDLPMSQPYKCWLSLMVSFPHRQRLTPQPAVRSQELEHQLECYLSSSAIRAFLVSLQDNLGIDSSFTEASRQFIGRCFASVYRVHLAQSRDDVLEFASLFFQPSQARRVYTAASPLLMNIRSKFRQIRPFPTVKVTRSALSSAQIRIRHAPRFQQDSNLIICKADVAWEAPIHGSLGQSYIGSPLIAEAIAMRLAFCMVQILEFPKLKVFTDISTLFRAISGNLQSKEIIGIVKDIRSISSGFASIFSCFSTLANVSAKEALKAFLSLY
uniref:RNase H type-1 domain-containing protein n=1 Tax=Brassica oleracea TaxID=3712 RepID=A0A3P6EW02_BRAOL|nr:unnamed protein product [Brassica oleracea]